MRGHHRRRQLRWFIASVKLERAEDSEVVDPRSPLARATTSPNREVICVIGACAVIALFFAFMSRYGFDLFEEGFFLSASRAVADGALPYRDISVPYTPGIFYLYAWLMAATGPAVIVARLLSLLPRSAFLLGTYVLGRQLMPPPFAAIPPIVLLVMDPAPELWSLHPAWYASAAVTVSALALSRYIRSGQYWWLFVAGLLCGIAFAFKQNLAAFELMIVLWFVVVGESHLPPSRAFKLPWPSIDQEGDIRVFRAVVKGMVLLALPLASILVTRQFINLSVILLLLLPLLALSLVGFKRLVITPRRSSVPVDEQLGSLIARPIVVCAGFALVTLPWLVPLLSALGGNLRLLAAFVGGVEGLAGYESNIKPLGIAHIALTVAALAIPVALVLGMRTNRMVSWAMYACSATGIALLVGYLVVPRGEATALPEGWSLTRTWAAAAPAWSPYAGTGLDNSGVLFMYLPTLAFWTTLGWLLLARDADGLLRARTSLIRLWLLAAGAAIMLNQYPRMDVNHMIWSSSLLLIVGADRLFAWSRWLTTRAGLDWRSREYHPRQVLITCCVLLLPFISILPQAKDRAKGALPLFDEFVQGTTLDRAKSDGLLQIENYGDASPLLAPAHQVNTLNHVIRIVHDETAANEPIFAYPEIPGIYYLTGRRNATEFNHVLRGMVSDSQQEEVVAKLAAVRIIVWDTGSIACGPDRPRDANGECDEWWAGAADNRLITSYISGHYHLLATEGIYTILIRNGV